MNGAFRDGQTSVRALFEICLAGQCCISIRSFYILIVSSGEQKCIRVGIPGCVVVDYKKLAAKIGFKNGYKLMSFLICYYLTF